MSLSASDKGGTERELRPVFATLAAGLVGAEAIVDAGHPAIGAGGAGNSAGRPGGLTGGVSGTGAGDSYRKAAVLALLTDSDSPDLIFTERAATLRKHPGQMSFPGGMREPGETPEQTALRESNEEIGLDPDVVRTFGRLPASSLPVSSFAVTPVLGLWDGTASVHVATPDEVAAIHRVPIEALVAPENRGICELQGVHVGPTFTYDDVVIWGFTAMIVDGLIRLAGWEQDWDHERMVEVPSRFRRY